MSNPIVLGALLGDLADRARDVVDTLGAVGVAALIALESVVPPIPSEVVLLLAGSLVAEGRFGPVLLLLAATLGSVAGALILYAVGALVGQDRLRWLLVRVGRFVLVKPADLDRAERWFERNGGPVVFFGRLVPVVRSLVSIPAGAERMPLGRFVALTAAGSALWNALFLGAGWVLGEEWERATAYADAYQAAVLAVIAVGIGVLVLRGWWTRRLVRAAAADPVTPEAGRPARPD